MIDYLDQPDTIDSFVQYEQVSQSRNQLMLLLAEYRDTDLDEASHDERFHQAVVEYCISALVSMNDSDHTRWLVDEAVARRHGLQLLGYKIDRALSDEAYAEKYSSYLAGELKHDTPMTIADLLFKDVYGERDMFCWYISQSN